MPQLISAGRVLKLAIATSLVVAAVATAVWAQAMRPSSAKPERVNELLLTCVEGERSVVLQAHARLPANAPGRIAASILIARIDGSPLARSRVTVVRRSRRVNLQRRLEAPLALRALQAAVGGDTCAGAASIRALSVRVRFSTPGGAHLRSLRERVRMRVQSTQETSVQHPDSSTGAADSATSVPPVDRCQALVDRDPPVVDVADLDEASGLALSRRHDGILWTHNDSGNAAELFAIDEGGGLAGKYALTGALNRDWEDISVGPGPDPAQSYLYVGDIGDNSAVRASITIYRVPEPTVRPSGDGSLTGAESQVLTYPDGARDAETLLVDPINGALYVISKREARSRVYRFSGEWDGAAHQLEYLGELSWGGAVAGDVARSGNVIALKSYLQVHIYERSNDESLFDALSGDSQPAPYLPEPQGEALALCGDDVYLTLSEGVGSPLYAYQR